MRLHLTVNRLLLNLTVFGVCNLCLMMYFLLSFLFGVLFILTICFKFLLRPQYHILILIQEPINLHPLFVLFQNIFYRFLFLEFLDQPVFDVVLPYIFVSLRIDAVCWMGKTVMLLTYIIYNFKTSTIS